MGGRFEIERLAGTGGMSEVFRARDRASGDVVALKVLLEGDTPETARFELEARVLADLYHPAIVRYLAHGTTLSGELYLAMEWLDGEDLQSHLLRARMSVEESITLALRIAEALGAAHTSDIVHRDLKPNNLFLVGRRSDQVKLLDFGIARLGSSGRMTQSGVHIGTPGYMAPEQARSGDVLDARVDVFSLGCVLFECLTGSPAFAGDNVMAVLVKTIYAEVPRVRELRPDVPRSLDALVAQMLSKKPGERPCNGAAVAQALASLGEVEGLDLSGALRTGPALTGDERRVLSVVLIGRGWPSETVVGAALDPSLEDAFTGSDEAPSSDSTTVRLEGVTMASTAPATLVASIAERTMHAVVAEHGGQFDRLADGTRVVTLASVGTAIDQAARAARCALLLQSAVPDQLVTLATGTGEVGGRVPVGEVIDRAARLLRAVQASEDGGEPHEPSVQVDELTARLLSTRFELEGRLLRAERDDTEGARTLLGKATSCVGRERELRALAELLAESAAEPVARAVLVTAPAGVGKSRLQQELLRRSRTRSEGIEVWIARGDPMRAGASFGLVGQIIRRAARLLDGEALEARRQKLAMHVARRVDASICGRVAEFLGEMAGTPFPDQASVQLRAARHDPMLMGDQMRRAWVDFVEVECRTQPLLLVLEDLHWGDRPSVELVDAALRVLRDQPLMVLALARPEVHERFPRLWSERSVMEMSLGELSRKAREKLTREVLGPEVSAETVERLVERSAGNAFFLEELLRAEAEGRGGDVPDTVLAMVQSRLATLEPLERRVLRAGSVFGQVFWRGGVDALLGGGTRPTQIDGWLAGLEQREWIAQRPVATFQGERELVFRNATVREAAYAMLTDEDRTLGHRLSGEWLERVGEPNAMVLAEHFDRGSAPARAIGWYHRAAAQALEGNDLPAAIARATRAAAIGATGEVLGELHLIRAEAHGWRGDNTDAERWALEAMAALPAGKTRWYDAVREAAKAASKLGHSERLAELAEALGQARAEAEASAPEAATMAQMVVSMTYAGLLDRTGPLHERLAGATEYFAEDPDVSARIFTARALRALYAGDAGGYLALSEAAQVRFEQAGDVRAACVERAHMGYACNLLGAYDEGAAILRAAILDAERMGLRNTVGLAKHNLGLALARTGALDEALAVETDAALTFAAQDDRHLECGARCYLAAILLAAGALDDAVVQARRAVEIVAVVPTLRPFALATLAGAMLAGGRITEARAAADEAAAILASHGDIEEGELLVLLMRAETLDASGDHTAARAAMATARERLFVRAARIADPARRASFLERVPEHARILDLARAWIDEQA